MGIIENITCDVVIVQFSSIKKCVPIRKNTYSILSITGSRIQFTFNLAFALTVHKAQGMTLDLVQIDCRHMSNPGQIGVALGRACSKKGLRIMNL